MKTQKVLLYRKLTRLSYAVSVILLVAGLVLSLVNTTALADSDAPDNPVPVIETLEEEQSSTETQEAQESPEPQEPAPLEPTTEALSVENNNGHNQNGQNPNQGNGQQKTIVCHVTASPTNPFEEIEVANPSVLEAHLAHGDWIVDANNPCPPLQADQPTPQPTATLQPTATVQPTLPVQPDITGSIEFTTGDYSICQLTPTTITATVRVSLPAGVTARLQTSYYIVNPPNKYSPTTYWVYENVSDGDEITVQGLWPGVDPGDAVVEIHFGARLSFPENGIDNELDTAGLDVYWYPWVCNLPTATPTVPAPTPTPLPEPQDLEPSYFCAGDGVQFSLFNPNAYAVAFDWQSLEDPSQNGSDSVPAGESLMFFKAPVGTNNIRISWLLPDESPMSLVTTNGSDFCIDEEVTPTPTATQPTGGSNPTPTPTQPTGSNPNPTATPQPGGPAATPNPGDPPGITTFQNDPQPTLAPPAAGGDPGVLIPVTGGDFSAGSLARQLFLNLGLVFLGMAFVLNGVTNRLAKSK